MRSIKLATSADLEELADLYRHLNPATPDLSEERAKEIWAAHLAKGVAIFVGLSRSTIVASCTLITVPNLMRAGRPYALVENVVTHADYRRQGHGRAVVMAALDAAWSEGCYKAMLLTGRTDAAIVRFYQSCGFQPGRKVGYLAEPPV